jgi:probable HAF family extracellular repeat protein
MRSHATAIATNSTERRGKRAFTSESIGSLMAQPPRVALLLLCAISASASTLYNVTDLGTLGGVRTTSEGFPGINSFGQVTGYSYVSGNGAQHAFLYSNGVMRDLGTLGGANSYGEGINNSGQVTGYSALANGTTLAFLYRNDDIGWISARAIRVYDWHSDRPIRLRTRRLRHRKQRWYYARRRFGLVHVGWKWPFRWGRLDQCRWNCRCKDGLRLLYCQCRLHWECRFHGQSRRNREPRLVRW